MILARCLIRVCLIPWAFISLVEIQELVLVWLPGKCCVCGMGTKGHQCHLVQSFSYGSTSPLFEFRWTVLRYEFTSVYRNFLVFLKAWGGPALSKGISLTFLVHVSICWGAACDVYSELPYYVCDSSDLQNALVHLGGLIFFFWTFFSNLSLINWDIKIFDALLPFHKVWSAKYLNYIMLKSNNIFCDWNIRNSFPNIKSQLSFSKKQKFCSNFCYFIYLTEQEESVLC